NGYYVLTTFQMDGTKLTEVETKLNITESILKYMIVKND
ncbi:MAG: 30S ribosomal protein S6, partial [Leptotrichiaceae bacterium]